jgi:hypothetical protein
MTAYRETAEIDFIRCNFDKSTFDPVWRPGGRQRSVGIPMSRGVI